MNLRIAYNRLQVIGHQGYGHHFDKCNQKGYGCFRLIAGLLDEENRDLLQDKLQRGHRQVLTLLLEHSSEGQNCVRHQ